MSCNYPKRFCAALSVATKAVTLNETCVLCIKGIANLPSCFYFLYDVLDPNAEDTFPILISTSSGNVPLVDANLTPVTYGDLVFNSVYSVAKLNICSNGDCCSNNQITYFQLIGTVHTATGVTETAATSNSTTVTGGTDSSFL